MAYDYVIVGAGTAGCVLANRLSADPAVRVALLEAGPADTRAEIHIPAAFSRLFGSEVDWNYFTAPQAGCADRAMFWPRGKTLGGSSSINAMIYIRGHRADFDGWAAAGCAGWGYADLLPYFRRSESNARGASAYHGAGGPLRVEDPREPSPIMHAFLDAAEAAGVPRNDDFNGPEQEGAGFYQLTQRGGRRHSAAAAFLKPVRRRRNLAVVTGAHATRVEIEGGRAVAVEARVGEATRRFAARREVILAGGAINSPQLLMLSGVGAAGALRAHGIDVAADRPGVGQNLQDHLIVGLRYLLRTGAGSLLDAERPFNVLRYLVMRRGGLSSNVAEAGLFAHTRPGLPAPDLQFHAAPALFENHNLVPATEHGFSLGPTVVDVHSRGHVTLASADPFAHPTIDPNYLADERDVATLVEGLRLARRIAAQAPLDPFRGAEVAPGPSVRTDDELAAYVRETCETLYHPVGTCRMGADDASVVDLELRVRGVRGLRVVDASVMPTIVRGNTNAATLAIAEKAADLVLAAARRADRPAQASGDGAVGQGVLT